MSLLLQTETVSSPETVQLFFFSSSSSSSSKKDELLSRHWFLAPENHQDFRETDLQLHKTFYQF